MSKVFKSVFPYNQELVAEYPLMSTAAIDLALEKAAIAYRHWSKQDYAIRAGILY